MEELLNKGIDLIVSAGGKIVLALLVFIIGRIIIKRLLKTVENGKALKQMDPTFCSFLLNFLRIALYVILIISIISVLGVPMASVITVLASAGVAVGLALQGALSNLAGGIMLLIFRPFKVGDYIMAAGEEGVVKEITLIYTVLTTVDNKRVSIPNGSLMNANVTNCSSEQLRRVDLVFSCGKGNDISTVQNLMLDAMSANTRVLKTPEPFARLSGGTNETMEFTVRAWCQNADYWDVYFGLKEEIAEAMGKAGLKAPVMRILAEKDT